MKNPALLEEIKTYKGRDEVPEDFDAFWDEEVKKVSNLPAYQLEERNFHIPQVKCYELTFEGSKEGKVYARVVLPKSEDKVPMIFHFHGYMGLFFYTKIGSIIFIGDLPTTNIIEPKKEATK